MKAKRRWSWTSEQLRKTRTYNHKTRLDSPPKWFRDQLRERLDTHLYKKAIHRFLREGKEFTYSAPRTPRSSAKWYWW